MFFSLFSGDCSKWFGFENTSKTAVKYTPVFQLKDKYDWDGHVSLNYEIQCYGD